MDDAGIIAGKHAHSTGDVLSRRRIRGGRRGRAGPQRGCGETTALARSRIVAREAVRSRGRRAASSRASRRFHHHHRDRDRCAHCPGRAGGGIIFCGRRCGFVARHRRHSTQNNPRHCHESLQNHSGHRCGACRHQRARRICRPRRAGTCSPNPAACQGGSKAGTEET